MKEVQNVAVFVAVAFLLLGVLFGMNIMTFIFAQIGPANAGLTVSDAGFNESLQVQNNSLQAIVTYSAQASTQFTTVAIAITLIILIVLFLIFWKSFISPMMKGSTGKGGREVNFGA